MPDKITHSKAEYSKGTGQIKISKMPVYFCTCGEAILIIPYIPAMNEAIKAHLTKHLTITGQVLTEDALTQEILKKIAKHHQQF